MDQIKIGTCVPGEDIFKWIPFLIENKFETLEVYYTFSLKGADFVEMSKKVKEQLADTGIQVSSVGFYCNPLQSQEQKKELEYCIDHASLFGAKSVNTFAGAFEGGRVEEAMPKFKEVFTELTKRAASHNLNIGIENCPMGGTWENTTCNIGFNPRAWEMMFHEVPADNLGLEWEPTHQMAQLIDPVAQLRQWVHKVNHIHGKDATMDYELIKKYGVNSGLYFCQHRTPGFGDTDWRKIISILHQGGYNNDICIEGFHDPVYRDEWELTGQLHALSYLKWCRGNEFVPNPWDIK